jgi:creatinine amidohydrolase/Fe(II)-dependent formamide hydrolase-like protein
VLADYVGWDKLAPDGSWGRYDPEADAGVATAEVGRVLLETFVSRQAERLKEHLAGACRLKGIA